MARQLFVLVLIFVAMSDMVMAGVAPSTSPISSPSSASAPNVATTSSSPPTSSPKASHLAPSIAPSTSDNEEDISAPPAKVSGPIELYASGPAPVNDEFAPEATPAADEATNGASTIRFSIIAATIAIVSFFAF